MRDIRKGNKNSRKKKKAIRQRKGTKKTKLDLELLDTQKDIAIQKENVKYVEKKQKYIIQIIMII